jgi:hypothetical protein
MPCPDATSAPDFRSRLEPFMGAPGWDVPEFGLTRLCRKLSLRIQAPAVSDRTMTGGENPRSFRTGVSRTGSLKASAPSGK